MWGYPSHVEYFRSPLPPAQLLRRVEASVAPTSNWGLLPVGWFKSVITADSFEIRRTSGVTNGFPPVLNGWVKPSRIGPGSWLKLQYRKQTSSVFSAAGGAVFILLLTMVIVIPAVQGGQLSKWCLLIPPAVLALFATLVVASFRFDIWLSRRQLGELLDLEISSIPADS
jgi:hypothetical protein